MEVLFAAIAAAGLIATGILTATLLQHLKKEKEFEAKLQAGRAETHAALAEAEAANSKMAAQEVTLLEAKALTNRYSKVADAEEEVAKLRRQAKEAQARFEPIVRELNQKMRQLSAVDEDLNSVEVGLYKPHYDWNDSQKFRLALDNVYARQKDIVKQDGAAYCAKSWTVEGNQKRGRNSPETSRNWSFARSTPSAKQPLGKWHGTTSTR